MALLLGCLLLMMEFSPVVSTAANRRVEEERNHNENRSLWYSSSNYYEPKESKGLPRGYYPGIRHHYGYGGGKISKSTKAGVHGTTRYYKHAAHDDPQPWSEPYYKIPTIAPPPPPTCICPPVNLPTPPTIGGAPEGPGVYGLQPSCFNNDEGAFNICLDLTSTRGIYEPNWMDDVISAAARWERTITGDIPPMSTTGLGQPNPPDLSENCTSYPPLVDDFYLCAQDVDLPTGSLTLALAGPYLFRMDDTNPDVLGLPWAARALVNNANVNDPDLMGVVIHEICHALGFPNLSKNYSLITEDNSTTITGYATGTNADREWKALGCSGPIPIQPEIQGHWDETCLVDELMTPINTGNLALSRITIAAMEDLGYVVNYDEAEQYTINDLGACGTFCPEAGRRLSSKRLGVPKKKRRELAEAEITAVMESVKDDLMYFHWQLQKPGFVQGEHMYAMEQIDVLFMGSDGELHSLSVTYEDVKDM